MYPFNRYHYLNFIAIDLQLYKIFKITQVSFLAQCRPYVYGILTIVLAMHRTSSHLVTSFTLCLVVNCKLK